MFRLDGFKVAFLTSQNLGAETPARRTHHLFVGGTILLKASHTLHCGRYKTDAQLSMFRETAFTAFVPMGLNRSWAEFREFTQDKTNDPIFSVFLNLAKYLIKNGLNDLQFAHVSHLGDYE
jgi:hypothetical protein